jgi:hypothetical protein
MMCILGQKNLGRTVVIEVTSDHLPGLQRFGSLSND